MKELYELRLFERYANRMLSEAEGIRLGAGLVRLLRIYSDSQKFLELSEFNHQIKNEGRSGIFSAWKVHREYSNEEIESANLFHLTIWKTFEPAGEENGTEYDEASACPICGSGATQITPLFLPKKRIPTSQDISRTIAGEIIVSGRVKDLFAREDITGAMFSPVRFVGGTRSDSNDWFQLHVHGDFADISPHTRIGIDPFDEDERGECRCPWRDLLGLNLLSEVSIVSATRGDADIFATRQFVGVRRGMLRPERIVLVSSRLRKLIMAEKLKGFRFEVAYLV